MRLGARLDTVGRRRRIVSGLAVLTLALLGIGRPWTWAGLFPLVMGAVGWCPFARR